MHYKHVADFLADQSSAELSGWITYERLEEEKQVELLTYAIAKAFSGKPKASAVDDDDEEIIDTTQPEFAEKFQFTNTPQSSRPQRSIPARGTQILKG